MANLTETSTYDSGIYMLETTDPVIGGASGVSNSPHKNLANRTKYLKDHVDALETAAALLAPLASPGLTGSPTAPTQALGDNSTKIATDAFVQATLGGLLTKSVAGSSNVTLTAVEAGNGILKFTGALTGDIAVIVPTSPTRDWLINNATSGSFTLTVKTAAGTGVVVAQGGETGVYTDGTNVNYSLSVVTQAEAEARTATTLRGWTAQRVGQAIAAAITALVVQATETVKGIAEIATQAETNAGTDDARIVTPLKLRAGFSISLGSPGYVVLPTWMSGLVIQWGVSTTGAPGGSTVTFPLAFPTACLLFIVNDDSTSVGGTYAMGGQVINRFTAQAWYDTGIAGSFSFFAIGY